MKALSFNDVPAHIEEKDLANFTFSAFGAFFALYDFEPDTMYVSNRIYAAAIGFADRHIGFFEKIGSDAKLIFHGLHLVNTGVNPARPTDTEVELSDIGDDIGEAIKKRVKAKRLLKGKLYTMEERVDFPSKLMRFCGIVPMQPDKPLSFDEEAVIDGDKVVELQGAVVSLPLEDVDKFYEVSILDILKL